MWIFKWIFGALLIIIILGFAIQNQEQTVSVHIIKWQSPIVPLYLIVYLSFIAGLVTWLIVSSFKIFSMKGNNLSLQKELKKVKEELNRLRNANIEEEIETSDIQETEDTTESINKSNEE
ncbi:MAG: LapA family protein [bacterium]